MKGSHRIFTTPPGLRSRRYPVSPHIGARILSLYYPDGTVASECRLTDERCECGVLKLDYDSPDGTHRICWPCEAKKLLGLVQGTRLRNIGDLDLGKGKGDCR